MPSAMPLSMMTLRVYGSAASYSTCAACAGVVTRSRNVSSWRSRAFSSISCSTWLARCDCRPSFCRASSSDDCDELRASKYLLPPCAQLIGCIATHCTGRSAVATTIRSGCVILNRVSATIRNSASALNTVSLDSAEGPCLKKGGGVRSRVPKGMGAYCPGFKSAAGMLQGCSPA